MGGDFHVAELCLIACGQRERMVVKGGNRISRDALPPGAYYVQQYSLRHPFCHGDSYVLGVLSSAAYWSSNPLPIGNGGFLRVEGNQTPLHVHVTNLLHSHTL
jgi:hypothetical protein